MKLKMTLLGTGLALALGVAAFAQSAPSQDPAQGSQTPSTTTPSTQEPASQYPSTQSSPTSAGASSMSETSFTGTLAKSGGNWVLHGSNGDYKLKDADSMAKDLEGKQVKVTGTLDSKGNTIKVKTIEPGA